MKYHIMCQEKSAQFSFLSGKGNPVEGYAYPRIS